MAKHTKGARGSTWDKHTNRDKGKGQKKQQSSSWVDQGKHTNSPRNRERSSGGGGGGGGGIVGNLLSKIFGK